LVQLWVRKSGRTLLLKWYLAHDLVVAQACKRIEAIRGCLFATFCDWATSERAKADESKDNSLEASGLGAKNGG